MRRNTLCYFATVLIIALGADDGLRGLSPKVLKQNLANMMQQAKQVGVQVLLLSMRIPTNYGKRWFKNKLKQNLTIKHSQNGKSKTT